MKTNRRHALALLGSTALMTACTPAIVSRDSSDPFEGGIGGTGIVGTLNGFGSLRINGLRVALTGRTGYRTPFGTVGSDTLQPGHVLTVAAERTAQGIVARDVMMDFALIGTLHHGGGQASVNGVSLIDASGALGGAEPGTRVAVSGTWTSRGVRPSRIGRAPVSQDVISGTVGPGPSLGGVTLLGLDSFLPIGTYAVAQGRATDDGFDVAEVESGRFRSLTDLRLLSVEGFLEPSPTAPGLRIAGLGHNFARDLSLGQIGTRRAVYFGRYDGLFGADRGFIVPNDFTARARLLETGLGDGFGGTVVRI